MYECNVIIVCWDALEYTKTTINSLFESTSNYNYRLTIIDNNSKPNAIEYLKSIEPPSNVKMDIIYNNSNVGIGNAYNQGLEKSIENNCRYTVFCNNDLLFSDGWLQKMVNVMNSNDHIALLNPLRPSTNDYWNERLREGDDS